MEKIDEILKEAPILPQGCSISFFKSEDIKGATEIFANEKLENMFTLQKIMIRNR